MAIDTETMQLIERIVARSLANATSLKGAAGEIAKGVTQYVGARYVPLFANPLEWDKTKAYEPLTIVLHQGNSYTSRQYVPVGVEIDNDSFWALTGNYNAQVEQYRQEVKSFDGRITANANAIEIETTNRTAAVTAEMQRAQSAERALQANVDTEKERAEGAEQNLQTNIETEATNRAEAVTAEMKRAQSAEQTLQANIDAEKNRAERAENALAANDIIVWCGDSWIDTAAYGGDVASEVSSYFGCDCVNKARGAQGWVYKTGGGANFIDQLTEAIVSLDANQKKHVKRVVCFGGVNDVTANIENSQIVGAIATFTNKAKQAFPNAIVYISPLQLPGLKHSSVQSIVSNFIDIRRALNALENNASATYFYTNAWFLPYGDDVWYGGDTLHLTDKGRYIFKNELKKLLSGVNVMTQINVPFNLKKNVKLSNPYLYVQDETCYLMPSQFEYTGTVNANNQVILADLAYTPYYGLPTIPPNTAVPVFYQATNKYCGWVWLAGTRLTFTSDWNGTLENPRCYIGPASFPQLYAGVNA